MVKRARKGQRTNALMYIHTYTNPNPHPNHRTRTGRSVMTARYSGPVTWFERWERPSCCTKLVELKGISSVMCTRRLFGVENARR